MSQTLHISIMLVVGRFNLLGAQWFSFKIEFEQLSRSGAFQTLVLLMAHGRCSSSAVVPCCRDKPRVNDSYTTKISDLEAVK